MEREDRDPCPYRTLYRLHEGLPFAYEWRQGRPPYGCFLVLGGTPEEWEPFARSLAEQDRLSERARGRVPEWMGHA